MNQTHSQDRKSAIIIGAGPAGLTAAYELLRTTDVVPVILEESSEIGGISRTVNHNGNRMDIGGHRFFSKNEEVMNFWTQLLPLQGADSIDDILLSRKKTLSPGGPDPQQEERVMLLRRRVSRILYLRKFFDYPISLSLRTIMNLGFFRTLNAGFGYLVSAVFKRKPERTLEDFMINRFGRPLYRMFFEDYNKKVWGRSPAEMSADWGAQRIKGLSLMKAVLAFFRSLFGKKDQKKVETSLIEEFYYPKKGPGQLWETLAEEIQKLGGKIVMNAKVTGIEMEDGKISAVIAEMPAETARFTGDYYLSSMPVKDLFEAFSDREQIDTEVYQAAVSLPYRDFITVGILVDRLNLKNETDIPTVGNIVPDCWIYVQERDVKVGRLQIFNNWSPYMVEDLEHSVWMGLEYFCDEGDELWEMPDKEFIAFAVDELVKIGVILGPDSVRDSVRIRVKKAYPAYFGSYEQFGVVRGYLDTIPNLYCIGRNGQHRYNNMDHSMLTAMECVRLIRTGNPDKSALWSVNTEQEYHESKSEQAG